MSRGRGARQIDEFFELDARLGSLDIALRKAKTAACGLSRRGGSTITDAKESPQAPA
jgi:hypothetical protein